MSIMGTVRVHMSRSLDGFVTGPDVSLRIQSPARGRDDEMSDGIDLALGAGRTVPVRQALA
jgi:hypothetical protein